VNKKGPMDIVGLKEILLFNFFLKNLINLNEIVHSNDKLSQEKIVQLKFARKGRYCLQCEFMESGNWKDMSVDIVVS
jgi:hypothetical protein